jgi:hypothetical protein
VSDPDQKMRRERSLFHTGKPDQPNYRSNKDRLEQAKRNKRQQKLQRKAA